MSEESKEPKTVDLTTKQILEFRFAYGFLNRLYEPGHPKANQMVYDVGNDVSYAMTVTNRRLKEHYEAADLIRKQLEAKRLAALAAITAVDGESGALPDPKQEAGYLECCKALGLSPEGDQNFIPDPDSEWGKLLATKRTVTPHRFSMKDVRPGGATIPPAILDFLFFMIREENT